jgi:hypothetical protein
MKLRFQFLLFHLALCRVDSCLAGEAYFTADGSKVIFAPSEAKLGVYGELERARDFYKYSPEGKMERVASAAE